MGPEATAAQTMVQAHRSQWHALSGAAKRAWEDRTASRGAEDWAKIKEETAQLKRPKTQLTPAAQEKAYDGPWLLSR